MVNGLTIDETIAISNFIDAMDWYSANRKNPYYFSFVTTTVIEKSKTLTSQTINIKIR